MASISPETATALEKIIDPMLSVPPFSLGYPDGDNQSNYYPGEERITKEDIAAVAKVMEKHSIEPENTRVRKIMDGTKPAFEILQASAETTTIINQLDGDGLESTIRVERGDHAAEMSRICSALTEAVKYAASREQAAFLFDYIESFSTGSLEAYRKSQKTWVTDISPRVENILGFVEPYRDPYGVRAEWEGAVCISDLDETRKLKALVDGSTKFIRMLPWAVPGENDGKGPFEAGLFQAPDFTIVHCR
jgi:dipeptidyl-peptidase III